jgi:tRNA (guanine-N7-)-methyltransferase
MSFFAVGSWKKMPILPVIKRRNLSKCHLRQHVNPLALENLEPLVLEENWLYNIFPNPLNPLILDIGCAKGGWVVEFARAHPETNILGLEIRESAVQICEERKAKSKLKNLHFYRSNANVDLQNILTTFHAITSKAATNSSDLLKYVTIQFPDPHFKKRNMKRRVVNTQLLEILSKQLSPQTRLFIQSDVKDVMDDMMTHITESNCFDDMFNYDRNQLEKNPNPLGIPTERETGCQREELPIYRMLFARNNRTYQVPGNQVSSSSPSSSATVSGIKLDVEEIKEIMKKRRESKENVMS